MARYRFRGQEFPRLTAADLTIDEARDLERLLGVDIGQWTDGDEAKAMMYASARAHDPGLLPWDEAGKVRGRDFEVIPDDEDEDDEQEGGNAPPGAAGDEPAASGSTLNSSSISPSPTA